MAKTTSKKGVEMSEDREMNGEDVNGWTEYTLSAVHPDFDIPIRIREDAVEGCDVGSMFKLMNKGYQHVQSNERKAAGGNRDEEKFPDREAFERTWALNKRQAIMDGSYVVRTTGPRGPRMSEFDQELRSLIDVELLLPRMMGAPLPKSGKTEINGQTLDYWREYCKTSPKYSYLHDKARENVAAKVAAAEAAKAKGGNAFADL